MAFPQILILHDRYQRPDMIFSRRWSKIIDSENERISLLETTATNAFDSNSTLPTLPTDIVREMMSFIPISISTLAIITDLVQRYHRRYILINGRGGEGLHLPLSIHPNHAVWLRENQQPKLRFSQPDFRKQITERAHQVLFRQLELQGDTDTQLSDFVGYLINKF